MHGSEGFSTYLEASVPSIPRVTLTIGITKHDNGYAVALRQPPERRASRVRPPQPNPFAGMSPDEIVDRMIDGVGAVLRTFRQAEAEEEWKGGEDREKVRTAFKVMFPQLAQQAVTMTEQPETPPSEEEIYGRSESCVFESKESLMKYLDENLKST